MAAFVSIMFLSCGQNDTKQKELELKERELALKEKEFALKQNDSSTNKTPVTTTTLAPTAETKIDVHSDFQTFWADFKKAINDGNKDVVASMTNIPFKDKYREELSMVQGIGKPRTSNSIDEFKSNYSKIFTSKVISLINSNEYIGYEKRSQIGNSSGDFKKGQYLLLYDNDEGLLFSKVNGVYKLLSIPHYDMTVGGD
jgi:hypothetical protein